MNCRMFPSDTPEVVRADIERLINDTTVKVIARGGARPPAPSPLLPELFDAVTQRHARAVGPRAGDSRDVHRRDRLAASSAR